ncbi:endonuclease/exonuclease/phosphatase family protein [Cryptosporidium muris RN66]|uniref:Endonuclease/exonuclease/phosphatase family protein n=1 Tax=Cryptosporidium muris (strain RN66) TaxID=441375 RepID=B6ADH7_CRYMR|nr:endonuclease/exonuclease/phosphatase family protein [Cryptosporidium muris RN66]EEA06268.1 endonuclease/exonuclease/phosphatase family protein [Cryptosporidium muris RN66]|eukprot:XP_002140617.1 endonuclease/exonuclease/phosphatase family protein [Cryptosporidium muris RN66]
MWMEPDELPESLSFLTFNAGLLEYRLCGIKLYQNPPYTAHRLLQIPSAIRNINADIVALQEVFDSKHSDYLIESLLPMYPFYARETKHNRNKSRGILRWRPLSIIQNKLALHNGLLVLSKYPILHAKFTCFNDVTLIEKWLVNKGMLEVSIDLPGMKNSPLTLFNIHMASGAVNPESEIIEHLRNKEIEQLLDACDRAIRRGEIPMIIGDLNAAPTCCGSNYQCFTDRGWRDCFNVIDKESHFPTKSHPHYVVSFNSDNSTIRDSSTLLNNDLYDDIEKDNNANTNTNEGIGNSKNNIKHSNSDYGNYIKLDIDLTPVVTQDASSPSILQEETNDVAVVNKLVSSFAVARAAVEAAKRGFTTSCSPNSSNIEVVSATPNVGVDGDDSFVNSPDSYSVQPYILNSNKHNLEATEPSDFTWDPNNPLNTIGPHSSCHGQRCDHIFLPPIHFAKLFSLYKPYRSRIILKEPRVLVDGWCFGCVGSNVLVTLSDHYGFYVELKKIKSL